MTVDRAKVNGIDFAQKPDLDLSTIELNVAAWFTDPLAELKIEGEFGDRIRRVTSFRVTIDVIKTSCKGTVDIASDTSRYCCRELS